MMFVNALSGLCAVLVIVAAGGRDRLTLSRESDRGLLILSGWVGDRARAWRTARNAGAADTGDRWDLLEEAIVDAHRRGVSVDALAASAGLRPHAVWGMVE